MRMPESIQIEQFQISSNSPVFIIAEAGVNHNGDVAMAKELIASAKDVGADCVKFQTFKAERVVTAEAPKAEYQLQVTDPKESQRAMLKQLELSLDVHQELFEYARDLGIVCISTPYNVEDVDLLDELDIPAFKMASIHIAEPYFLRYVAEKGKPMIVSTGMATLAEVDTAVRTIRETGNEQFVLLQCTTNYPSKPDDANLLTIPTMQQAFNAWVGYSDHTQNDNACIASVGLGARMIEKHFTLDKTLPGPDQSTSYEPDEFRRLVDNIRETEILLGSNIKAPTDVEKMNAVGMRRSVVAKVAIPQGTIITAEMLTFKRPATGLKPVDIEFVLGKVARVDIPADAMLSLDDVGR